MNEEQKQSEEEKKEIHRQFMRDYMKKRYQTNPSKEKRKKNNKNALTKGWICQEDINRYGEFASDISKIKKLMSSLPIQFVDEIITSFQPREITEEENIEV